MSNELATSKIGLPEAIPDERAKGVFGGFGSDNPGDKAERIRNRGGLRGAKFGTIAKGSLMGMSNLLTTGSGDMAQKDAASIMDPLSDMSSLASTASMSIYSGFATGMNVDKAIQSGKDIGSSYGKDWGLRKGRGVEGEDSKAQKDSDEHGQRLRKKPLQALGGKGKQVAIIGGLIATAYGGYKAYDYMSEDKQPAINRDDLFKASLENSDAFENKPKSSAAAGLNQKNNSSVELDF